MFPEEQLSCAWQSFFCDRDICNSFYSRQRTVCSVSFSVDTALLTCLSNDKMTEGLVDSFLEKHLQSSNVLNELRKSFRFMV